MKRIDQQQQKSQDRKTLTFERSTLRRLDGAALDDVEGGTAASIVLTLRLTTVITYTLL